MPYSLRYYPTSLLRDYFLSWNSKDDHPLFVDTFSSCPPWSIALWVTLANRLAPCSHIRSAARRQKTNASWCATFPNFPPAMRGLPFNMVHLVLHSFSFNLRSWECWLFQYLIQYRKRIVSTYKRSDEPSLLTAVGVIRYLRKVILERRRLELPVRSDMHSSSLWPNCIILIVQSDTPGIK